MSNNFDTFRRKQRFLSPNDKKGEKLRCKQPVWFPDVNDNLKSYKGNPVGFH